MIIQSKTFLLASILSGVGVLAGCAHVSVEYSSLNSPPRPLQSKSPAAVELFASARPSRRYVEIGSMKALRDSVASDEDMLTQIKSEAASHGCDGAVITQRGDQAVVAACIVYVEN